MGHALGGADPAAFQDYGWTKREKSLRLGATGPGEVHDGAAETVRELQAAGIERIDADMVRAAAARIVDVYTGEQAPCAQAREDLREQARLGTRRLFRAGPRAVEVDLVIEMAPAVARGFNVADKQAQRAWKPLPLILREQTLDRQQPRILVAVLQDRDEQRIRALAGELDQGRTG